MCVCVCVCKAYLKTSGSGVTRCKYKKKKEKKKTRVKWIKARKLTRERNIERQISDLNTGSSSVADSGLG